MNILENKALCVGCGACASCCPCTCITMEADEEGFLYPQVDGERCIGCGRCRQVCPVLARQTAEHPEPRAYGAHARDSALVQTSSSGGVFTLLAQAILDRGGVVFGAAFNGPRYIRHIAVDSAEGLSRLRGSKYVQSEIGQAFCQTKALLQQGRWVLFSGTPCQVAGLRTYLQGDDEKLVCVDTFCHSVPSPRAWSCFLDDAESMESSKVAAADFRKKLSGWERYYLQLQLENGKLLRWTGADNLYMQAFLRGLSTRPSCYTCKFKGENHYSDITLGDFWGVRYAAPECLHEEGTSLVLVQTEKGQQLLSCCLEQLELAETVLARSLEPNPAYSVPSKPHPERETFFSQLGTIPFHELVPPYLAPTPEERRKARLQNSLPARALRYVKRQSRAIFHKGP